MQLHDGKENEINPCFIKNIERNDVMTLFVQHQLLENQVDFDNAMFLKIPVSVWRGNQFVDFGGYIQKHDTDAVIIAGDYFLKNQFAFKVR